MNIDLKNGGRFKIKLFETITTNTKTLEGWEEYIGTDLTAARKALEDNRSFNDDYSIEIRVYEIPDDTDMNDEYEVTEAICNAAGYDIVK